MERNAHKTPTHEMQVSAKISGGCGVGRAMATHHWLMSNRHHAKALNGRPRAEAIEFSIGIWQATQSEEKLIRTQQWKLLLSQTAVPFLLHFHAADLIAGRTQGLAAAKQMCPKQASVTSTCHNTLNNNPSSGGHPSSQQKSAQAPTGTVAFHFPVCDSVSF